jgi:hypothetical protein
MKLEEIIDPHNYQAHIDIERDIKERKDGQHTFTLRINQGQIVDYSKYDTVTAKDYADLLPRK